MKHLFFLIILSIGTAYGQSDPLKLFSVQELQEDYLYWKQEIEENSPLLYHYNSKVETDAFFDSILNKIDHPMNSIEFYRLIAITNSFIKNSHTSCNLYRPVLLQQYEDALLLPLELKWIEDKSIVSFSDLAKDVFIVGTHILSINNVSTETIFKTMHQIMPDDGASRENALHMVNSNFEYCYLVMFGSSATYEIEYISKLGEKKDTVISGINWDAREELRAEEGEPADINSLSGITLQLIDSINTAILTIDSFDHEDIKANHHRSFRKEIADQFGIIKNANVEHLVIDLRNNSGGEANYCVQLLKHLMPERFTYFVEGKYTKRPNEVSLKKRTGTKHGPSYSIGKYRPHSSNFQGSVYLLVNGGSSSSASDFAGVFRKYQRGTIVGVETGGNPIVAVGFYRNRHYKMKMPNTQNPFTVGSYALLIDAIEKDTNHNLIPDFVVEQTIEDLINTYDRQLMHVFNMID